MYLMSWLPKQNRLNNTLTRSTWRSRVNFELLEQINCLDFGCLSPKTKLTQILNHCCFQSFTIFCFLFQLREWIAWKMWIVWVRTLLKTIQIHARYAQKARIIWQNFAWSCKLQFCNGHFTKYAQNVVWSSLESITF